MSDEDLVNALAQYLDLEPLEKQALLEHHSLRARAESLVELLEMKIDDGAHARPVERRALAAGRIATASASARRPASSLRGNGLRRSSRRGSGRSR